MPTIQEMLNQVSPITGSAMLQPKTKDPLKIGFQGPTKNSRQNKNKSIKFNPVSVSASEEPVRTATSPKQKRVGSFDIVNITDLSARVKSVEAGFRLHKGYSPSADTISRIALSPVKTGDIDKMFSTVKPKWMVVDAYPQASVEDTLGAERQQFAQGVTALAKDVGTALEKKTGQVYKQSKAEFKDKPGVQTALRTGLTWLLSATAQDYAKWTNMMAATLAESPELVDDRETIGNFLLENPGMTGVFSRTGKMVFDQDFLAERWKDDKTAAIVDGVVSLMFLLPYAGTAAKGLSKVDLNILADKIPPHTKRIITRSMLMATGTVGAIPGEGKMGKRLGKKLGDVVPTENVIKKSKQYEQVKKAADKVKEKIKQIEGYHAQYLIDRPENYLYKQIKEQGGIKFDKEVYAGLDKEEVNKIVPVFLRSGKKTGMSIDEMASALNFESADSLTQALRDIRLNKSLDESLPFADDLVRYRGALGKYEERLQGIKVSERTDFWEDDIVEQVDELAHRHPSVKKAIDEIVDYAENKSQHIPSPKYAGSINLERLDTTDDVTDFILHTSERYKGKIDEARRGTITNDELKRLAADLDMSPKQLINRKAGKAWNAEEILAAREINLASAEDTFKAAQKALKDDSTENLVNFMAQIERHSAIQASVSGLSSEAGRALQAHKILAKSNPEALKSEALKAMIEALGGREVTQATAERMAKIDPTDIVAVNKFIRNIKKSKASDKIFEAWVNAILSGPVTHIVNATSNTLTALSRPVERVASASLDLLSYPVTGKRNRFAGEAVADIIGMSKGVTDGVRKGLWSFINEMPASGTGKIEVRVHQSIKGVKGRIIRTPGNLLVGADEFFKSVNYTGDLYARAYRQAAQEGLSGNARLKRIAQIIDNPLDEMVKAAKGEAAYRTFTNDLGKYGKKIAGVRDMPAVRYIIPFLRTPINIAKYGIERTPLEFLNLAHKAAIKDLPEDAIDRLARATIGSLIGAGVTMYAAEGLITGGGPKDKAERDALYRQGWQPYSVKVGDKYYSYQRLEPLGMTLGLAADYYEITSAQGDKDAGELATSVMLAISKNVTSKTFMSGLFNVMNAASDPERYGEKWVESMASSTVPSVVWWAVRSEDSAVKNPEGALEAIKAKLPILSKDIKAKRNVWGDAVKQEGNAIWRMFSPSRVSTLKDDPVEKELDKLGIFVNMPNKQIAGVKIDDDQHDRYIQASGKLAKERLNRLVASDGYGAMSAFEKESAMRGIIEGARSEVGIGIVLKNADGGETIISLKESSREAREQAYKAQGNRKLKPSDAVALREWYLSEVNVTLTDEIIPNAGKSREGWERFNEAYTMLQATMLENEVSWQSDKMKKVKAWFMDEVNYTKQSHPEFAKEFEKYPFSVWVTY